MTLPHAALVCAGAAALVLVAHVVVFVLRRRAQLDQEPDSPVVTAFGFGVCTLALAPVVISLKDATQLGEVLLLLGTGAGIMAAAIPLLPVFSPQHHVTRDRATTVASSAGRRATQPQRAQRPAIRRTPGGSSGGAARASAGGQGWTRAAPDASVRAVGPPLRRGWTEPSQPDHTAGSGPNGRESRGAQPADVVSREAHRLGLSTSRPPAMDAPTVPIVRIDVSAPRPRTFKVESQDDPEPHAPVRDATETLEQLDRVVDDLTGALHLDRRDPV